MNIYTSRHFRVWSLVALQHQPSYVSFSFIQLFFCCYLILRSARGQIKLSLNIIFKKKGFLFLINRAHSLYKRGNISWSLSVQFTFWTIKCKTMIGISKILETITFCYANVDVENNLMEIRTILNRQEKEITALRNENAFYALISRNWRWK